MAFGNGMGSPEDLAMKLKELAGQMRPQQTDPVGIGMNVNGPTMQRPPDVRAGTPGPFVPDMTPDKQRFQQPGTAQSKPPIQQGAPVGQPGMKRVDIGQGKVVDMTDDDINSLNGKNGPGAQDMVRKKYGMRY